MARIRWHGSVYTAKPVKQLNNGDWLMRSMEAGPRFTVGTMIQVKDADVVTLDDSEANPAARAAELEAAMAEERKTLQTVKELLALPAPTEAPAE